MMKFKKLTYNAAIWADFGPKWLGKNTKETNHLVCQSGHDKNMG
jgi:hypothetical protein